MKKTNIIILLFLSTSLFSQEILLKFPEGQLPYKNGYVQFYKDFNKILTEKNLAPCENKNEYYEFKVLIKTDSSISFVKDEDSFDEQNSKCTKELSREVAKYLQDWNPATQNGIKVPAVARFHIIPDQLFGVLKENYGEENEWKETLAEFPGGFHEFRKIVANRVNLSGFRYENAFRLVITFVVEKDGSIGETKLSQSSGLLEFDNMVLNAVSKIKKKWKPATINDIPVRYRYRLPLAFQSPN